MIDFVQSASIGALWLVVILIVVELRRKKP